MSDTLNDFVIDKFFDFYREDLESEIIDENNLLISFPVHFSGFHRIEVTVTRVNPTHFLLSDNAKTMDELRNAGYSLGSKLNDRIKLISRAANLRVVDGYLVSETSADKIGSAVQRFVEALKTIGDAYLVQRASPPRDENLFAQVSSFLVCQSVPFQTNKYLEGRIEKHSIDFLFPPNGLPGLALSILGHPSRMAAEAWAFKAYDIKGHDARMKVGVVYEEGAASEKTRKILDNSVDVSVPSSELPKIAQAMRSIGILGAK